MKYGVTFHPSWWHKNAGIRFVREFFDDPEYRMDCDVRMRKALYEHFGAFGLGEKEPRKRPLLGTDLLAAGYLHSELMGCDIVYQEGNSPQVVAKNLDEDSMDDIGVPELDKSPVWAKTRRQIDYLLEKYGRVETYVNLMGVQNVALDLMGQNLMMAYYTEPEKTRALLGKITGLLIDVGRRFRALSEDISGGVTAVVRETRPDCYLTSNCSVEMVSNDLYESFLLERDQELADAFGSFGIHHCGQSMEHVARGYAKVRGLTFAEVGAGSDIRTVRECLPGIHLNARYSPARLMTAGEDEIQSEVRALVANGKDASGGGISVSCVGIDGSVSDKKILAFLSACSAAAL